MVLLRISSIRLQLKFELEIFEIPTRKRQVQRRILYIFYSPKLVVQTCNIVV